MTVRERVILLVSGLGALGGALAGAAAALLATIVLKPSEPVTASDIVTMVVSYGVVTGVAGAVLGTAVAFGLLRHVRLSRVLGFGTTGAFLGLAYGWIGGPWAWHHFGTLGITGLLAGALTARVFTRSSAAENSISSPFGLRALAPSAQIHAGSVGHGEVQRDVAGIVARAEDDQVAAKERRRVPR